MASPGLTSNRLKEFRNNSVAEIAVACIGCALIAAAIAANQAWFDRHFLPSFFTPRQTIVQTETGARIAVAVAGIIVLALSKRLARLAKREPFYIVTVAIAVLLAVTTAELVLRKGRLRAAEEVPRPSEPLRHFDSRLGWLFDRSRTGFDTYRGQRIAYVFDGNGYRVASPASVIDFDAPAIVFTGESMMVGERLEWPETIPARTSAMLKLPGANIAVSGFATDQAYLRLVSELPRFRRPVAVVALFTPSLFNRNLDDDRPHLGSGLVWLPPVGRWRLMALARRAIGYRSEAEIERGIAVTREVLTATIQFARSRGAVGLIVVPEFGPEQPRERELRERILDQTHLPYVRVTVDPDDRLEDDGHPNGDGAARIAEAIAGALRPLLGRAGEATGSSRQSESASR